MVYQKMLLIEINGIFCWRRGREQGGLNYKQKASGKSHRFFDFIG
jgi:hypothetical protein